MNHTLFFKKTKLEKTMNLLSKIFTNRALLVLCALGFVWANSGAVGAQEGFRIEGHLGKAGDKTKDQTKAPTPSATGEVALGGPDTSTRTRMKRDSASHQIKSNAPSKKASGPCKPPSCEPTDDNGRVKNTSNGAASDWKYVPVRR